MSKKKEETITAGLTEVAATMTVGADELYALRKLAEEVYYYTDARSAHDFAEWVKAKELSALRSARTRERSAFCAGIRWVGEALMTRMNGHGNRALDERYPELPNPDA